MWQAARDCNLLYVQDDVFETKMTVMQIGDHHLGFCQNALCHTQGPQQRIWQRRQMRPQNLSQNLSQWVRTY